MSQPAEDDGPQPIGEDGRQANGGDDPSSTEESSSSAANTVPRRRFLALAGTGLGACVSAGVLGIAGSAVVATPLSRESGGAAWVRLGALSRFPQGVPVKVAALGEVRDAWSTVPARTLGNVIVRREGERVDALSATCPHNGCDVFVAEPKLVCPCHDSSFGPDGAVEAGPSPRPLDVLDAKVEDGEVWVRYQRFEAGVAAKRPL